MECFVVLLRNSDFETLFDLSIQFCVGVDSFQQSDNYHFVGVCFDPGSSSFDLPTGLNNIFFIRLPIRLRLSHLKCCRDLTEMTSH